MVWLDGAGSSRMTVPGIASLQKPSPERHNRSCSSPKSDQLFSPLTPHNQPGQEVFQEKLSYFLSLPLLGIVSQTGSRVDAESNLACSQLCLLQQVLKKANKKASLTPNKQTLKSQVEKNRKQGRDEDKSRVDGAGGLAMIPAGGHCPRQAGRERTDGFPPPSQGGTAQGTHCQPSGACPYAPLSELVAGTQHLHPNHPQTEPKNLPEVLWSWGVSDTGLFLCVRSIKLLHSEEQHRPTHCGKARTGTKPTECSYRVQQSRQLCPKAARDASAVGKWELPCL